ncbi:unnamed protein product [Caenorhabditis sp. 36 PRJEB53466]|nr:unnamed protein product [Caenorhabditis sp. 36 PRJEB53466]
MDGPDLYVATNFQKLTVMRFTKESRTPSYREVEAVVLRDQPFVIFKSGYQIITGHNYNHLNILTLRNEPEDFIVKV